jgi:hypothetical protein
MADYVFTITIPEGFKDDAIIGLAKELDPILILQKGLKTNEARANFRLLQLVVEATAQEAGHRAKTSMKPAVVALQAAQEKAENRTNEKRTEQTSVKLSAEDAVRAHLDSIP